MPVRVFRDPIPSGPTEVPDRIGVVPSIRCVAASAGDLPSEVSMHWPVTAGRSSSRRVETAAEGLTIA